METEKNNRSALILTGIVLSLLLFASCLMVPRYVSTLMHQTPGTFTLFFITRVLFWVAIGLMFLYAVKIELQPFLLWPEQTFKFSKSFLWVMGLLLITFAGSVVISIAIRLLKLSTGSEAVKELFKMGVPLKLLTVTTAAVTEELLFRGYLMPRLQLFFKNKYVPVVISAVLFGLGHYRYGTAVNVIVPLYIGLVFGFHYQKFRNIKILMICHFVIDFYALLVVGHQ